MDGVEEGRRAVCKFTKVRTTGVLSRGTPDARYFRDQWTLLLFGGDFGYSRYGYRGGIGIGGVLRVILIICLLLSRGRF
jgi:hypothetical protein